jgi:Tfp pilus assembly protein PilN
MRAVNLLPKDLQARKSIRQEDPAVVVGSALAVVVMIALGMAFYVAHGKEASAQKRLDADRVELAQLSLEQHPQPKPKKPAQPITPIVPPPSITGQEATWLSSVTTNLEQRIAWDRLLREVSLVMPTDVTLTSMTMSAPTAASTVPGVATPAPTGATQGFTIAGTAFSYDSVARLLSRLALVPDLSDVTLTSTGSDAAAGGSSTASPASSASSSSVTFNISAAVKGAPAPPPTPTVAPVAPADTSSTTTGVSS